MKGTMLVAWLAPVVFSVVSASVSHCDDGVSPGKLFTDALRSGGTGPQMITVNAGRFQMGCVSGVQCQFNTPVHEVSVKKPFAMSVYEVTRGEFRRFVEQTGYQTSAERARVGCVGILREEFLRVDGNARTGLNWNRPGFVQTDEHPVVCVSWTDANSYVSWLASETARPYRLPSEAEWEYAARAGSAGNTAFPDVSQLCRDPMNNLELCVGEPYTEAVGSGRSNGLGLYDMRRNAYEWVQDCWNPSYVGAPQDGSARQDGSCHKRVLRGGGWARLLVPQESRNGSRVDVSENLTGFRVAQSPTD